MGKSLTKKERQQVILDMMKDPEGPYTMAEIIFQVDPELSSKTFYRDIEQLRRAGAEILSTQNGVRHEYELANDFILQHTFCAQDLLHLTILRQALNQYPGDVLESQMADLSKKINKETLEQGTYTNEAIDDAVSFRSPPAQQIDSELWQVLLDAALKSQQIQLRYSSRQGEVSEKTLWPYHLTCLEGEWYLLAGKPDDLELKQYSLADIQSVEPMPGKNHFDKPDDFDPHQLLEKSFGSFVSMGETVEVRVRITGFMVRYVRNRVFQANQTVKELEGGKVLELSFPANSGGPFPLANIASWVLGMGPYAQALEPPELIAYIKEEAQGILELYS